MTDPGARVRWAQRMIRRAEGTPPRYGSAEWLALPEGDALKVAAVVIAAECWAREADDLEDRLRVDLEFARIAAKAVEDAEYQARRDAHREEWRQARQSTERARKAQEYRREVYGDGYGRPA